MAQLRHVTTQFAGGALAPAGAAQMVGISALLAWPAEGGLHLYSAGAGLLGWSAGLGITAVQGYVGSHSGLSAPRRLLAAEIGGEDMLLVPGGAGAGIEGWRLGASGALAERVSLRYGDGAARALADLAVLPGQGDGADLLVGAGRQGAGIEVWQAGAGGVLRTVAAAGGTGPISALAVAELGAQGRVLALSPGENSLYSWEISPSGALGDMRQLRVYDGLFLDTPTLLEVTRVAGQSYALIGAGSGHLAVVALAAEGGMRVTDLVGDDLHTRFAGVTALASLTVDGQLYLVAGGRDDGLSLLTLLPGGRLLHLATLADDAGMALSDPAALALARSGSGAGTALEVYVAGGWPEGPPGAGGGISLLRAELGLIGTRLQLGAGADSWQGGAGNDQVAGGAGDDTLRGGGGDDVLIDGPGRDRLHGGAGADVFVIGGDGELDRIDDFEPGVDRIDLSGMGRFYTVAALTITPSATGARIKLGGDVLQVRSAAGTPLSAADFEIGDLRDLWHLGTSPIPEPQPVEEEPEEEEPGSEPDSPDEPPEGSPGEGPGGSPGGSPGGTPTAAGSLLLGGPGDDVLSGAVSDPGFDPVAASVYRLYRATLDRAPDATGLWNWSTRLLSGERDLVSVAAGFTGAPEFRQTYGAPDDAGFVTLLYRNVLGREPEPQGLGNWTARLEAGLSRERVVLGFSESPEFIAASAAGAAGHSREALQQGWTDDVFRLYQAVLDRAPDLPGLLNWSARLAQGRPFLEVVEGFTASAEFRQSYGALDAAGFVAQLYRNVLGREGDAPGQANWTARLEAGMTRAEVVRGFSQSAEFTARSAPDLLAFLRGPGEDDLLDGGGGANLLVGGMLSDRFVFRAEARGTHVVADLERWDLLVFEGFGFGSAVEIWAHLEQGEQGVAFSAQGSSVTLQGVLQSDIHDDMLLF